MATARPEVEEPQSRFLLWKNPLNYFAAATMNLVAACSGIGVSLLVTSDPRFQTDHVYSLLSLLLAASGVAAGLVAALLARVSDRVGRRPVILFSLVGFTGTLLLLGSTSTWWQLFAVMIVQACFFGIYWPSLEARLTDGVEGRQMATGLGIFGSVNSVGLFCGSVTGGSLSDLWIRAPFYVAASFAALLVLLLAWRFPREETHDGHLPRATLDVDPDAIRIQPSARRALVLTAWLGNFAVSAAAPILGGLFPRFATLPTAAGGLGLGGFDAGAILSAISVSMLLVFVVLGRYPFWLYRFRYLLLGQAASLLGCLLFVVSSTVTVLALGALLYGVGRGVTYFSSIYYALDGYTARARQSGWHEAVLAFGFAAGMLATAGMMWYSTSHRTPYWICVAILTGGLAAQVLVVLRANWGRTARSGGLMKP